MRRSEGNLFPGDVRHPVKEQQPCVTGRLKEKSYENMQSKRQGQTCGQVLFMLEHVPTKRRPLKELYVKGRRTAEALRRGIRRQGGHGREAGGGGS